MVQVADKCPLTRSHMTMASMDEVMDDNQHRRQNPEAKNTLQQQQNPNLTQLNPQSIIALEIDAVHPPNSFPNSQIGVDPSDDDVVMICSDVKSVSDDVVMISSDLKSVSDLNLGEEKRGFEGEEFEREVMGGGVENSVGFEGKRMGEENVMIRVLDGKKIVGENEMVIRRCNGFDGVECVEFEEEKVIQEVEDGEEEDPEEENGEEEEEEDDEEGGDFSLALQGEASTDNIFRRIEAMQDPYSNLFGSMVQTNSIHANSSQFFNGHDDGNVILHSNMRMAGSDDNRVLSSNKRVKMGGLDFDMRGRGTDFDMCMEQMQHLMGKTRAMYMEKEQVCAEASMSQEVLLVELQKQRAESQQLQATVHRMQQKRQAEVYRYEHELHHMVNLIKGYREALRDTKRKFMEYRERVESAEHDEPLYTDVSGGGGLVVSVTELEKQSLKEEEEEEGDEEEEEEEEERKNKFEKTVKDFEDECMRQFEEHKSAVELLNSRLLAVENQIEPLRELIAKRKVLKSSEYEPSS